VRLPYESISWLLSKLEAQGATLADLEKSNDGVVADMMSRMGISQPQQAPMDAQMMPQMMQ
jgi:hypothetical protein